MDETERLRLPAHAGALWRTTREITRRGIAELTGESGSYTIGGGTILAARWKHRSSSDIDIVVAEETRPGSVLARPDSSFRNGIETLRGTVAPRARGKLVTAGWADQKIDIWATTPMPASGAAAAIVDGNIETVLSTIQILRGKLERGEDCLVRDVYDVLRASELDRGSLVAAANGAGRRWARTIAGIWQAAKTRIGARAETLDTVEALERPERLGADAADAIRKAIYTRLEVGVDRGRILVSATTGFGDEKARTIAGVSDEAFERLGLNGYLAHQRPDGRRVRERAEEARRELGKYTRIYSEENGQVTAWHGDVPPAGQRDK
ncbi:MAG: hypothetical protein F4X11_08730 [Acidobacteria bacterium]|nr:hypothetical protein [Acidobacteriota bacterium]